MPIYEYRCASCGNEHEALQKITEPLLITCPACHKDTLTKLVSAAGFKLKGSGWYATDFKNGSKPAAKKTDSNKESGAEAKADSQAESTSKGESKGESKSESKSESTSNGSGRSETTSETKAAETKSESPTPTVSDASR